MSSRKPNWIKRSYGAERFVINQYDQIIGSIQLTSEKRGYRARFEVQSCNPLIKELNTTDLREAKILAESELEKLSDRINEQPRALIRSEQKSLDASYE